MKIAVVILFLFSYNNNSNGAVTTQEFETMETCMRAVEAIKTFTNGHRIGLCVGK